MSRCEYCKKTKTEWKELSFHRFPTDERTKLQWVRNMGRTNWMPKYYSSLCSEHFSKECIDFRDKLPRLRKGSIPTIFDHKKENISPPLQEFSELEHINHLNKRRKFDEDEDASRETNNVRPSLTDHLTHIQRKNKENETSINVVNHDHMYVKSLDTMKEKLNAALLTIKQLRIKNKLLNEKEERAKRKISNLKNIVQELWKTQHLLDDGLYILKEFEDIPAELFKRMHKNVAQKALTKAKYAPHLRCFTLTLHFYSPAAYNYVRKTFQLALPHPSAIRSWYNTIDAEPGFSEECFNTLKLKNEEYKKQNKCLICALVMDEMGIKKGFQRNLDGKMRGYVDIGVGTEGTSDLPKAKNALVMLVVALNDTWKLPIAFFLINGLSAETKANLINDALMRLHEVGVKITSLTLDGPAEHFVAVKRLGASMEMKKNAEPRFPHPVKDQPDIHVIIDPCHNLKNIRNAFADLSMIIDDNNNRIEWRYIKALALIHQDEGLRLGNKLRTIHIDYKKMIMKVFLAAQTLSASVADAIEFCWKVLRLPQFKGEATVQFIRCIDYIFDFLNVRNPWGKGFKSPLKSENEYI